MITIPIGTKIQPAGSVKVEILGIEFELRVETADWMRLNQVNALDETGGLTTIGFDYRIADGDDRFPVRSHLRPTGGGPALPHCISGGRWVINDTGEMQLMVDKYPWCT